MRKTPVEFVQPRLSIGLAPGDTLAEAAVKNLSFYFAELLRCEPGTRLGEDIEALHDMRVSSRRLRALFDVFGAAFKNKPLRQQVKNLRIVGRTLGKVRDWDVFLQKTNQDLRLLSEADQVLLQPVLAGWQSERAAARQEMVAFLDSQEYAHIVQRFNAFVQSPASAEKHPPQREFANQPVPSPNLLRDLAPVLLYTRLASVRAYSELLPTASLTQLHALRIEVKRLHYTLDFLKEVLSPESQPVLKTVKALQDHLGDLQDTEVACVGLERLLASTPNAVDGLANPLYQALEHYLAVKRQQKQALLDSLPQAWARFSSPANLALFALAAAAM